MSGVRLTSDVVAVTVGGSGLAVLLVRRRFNPFAGMWALPGGHVELHESAEDAALRELAEETGLVPPSPVEQLRTYSDPNRDPSGKVVTVGFVAVFASAPPPCAGDDAAEAVWMPASELACEGGELDLAFDHSRIVADGLARVASSLEYTCLATRFCPPEFTIAQLREVYEAVWRRPVTDSSFDRKVLSSPGFVVEVDEAVDAAGGTTALYRAGDATLLRPPMLRD